MTIVLRDYQTEMIRGCKVALSRSKRVLLQAPTGAGKTALATFIAGESAAKGAGVWFICHRAELVTGTSRTFQKFGIVHGFIASGYPLSLRELVQICSIDTLKNRLATLVCPKVALIDEGHHCAAAGWALVIEWLVAGGAYVILLSATPCRLDGEPLRIYVDEMVLGPTTAWLMENGHLAQYQAFIPDVPNMKGVRKQMGDFAKKDAAEKMDKPKLTGNIIKHWRDKAEGLKTIGFAVNVAHSQHLTDSFNLAGIRAAHLDGNTDKSKRKDDIAAYAEGYLDVLFNCGLFGEGFDLAAIAQKDVTVDCVIDAAPSQSLSAVMQRWGRCLRVGEVKLKIILDHAGNMLRHGFPDDPRIWTLDSEQDGSSSGQSGPLPPTICEGCYNAIKKPLPPVCPHCQKSLKAEQKEIEVADAELVAADAKTKEAVREKLRREELAAKDISALAAVFARRGEKNPMGKAAAEFSNRRYKKR